jgi:hypothetical protein
LPQLKSRPITPQGLWGSFFSRTGGRAMRRFFPRGVPSKIGLAAAPPVVAASASPEALQQIVRELRGDRR